jgi:hypothetical protein
MLIGHSEHFIFADASKEQAELISRKTLVAPRFRNTTAPEWAGWSEGAGGLGKPAGH